MVQLPFSMIFPIWCHPTPFKKCDPAGRRTTQTELRALKLPLTRSPPKMVLTHRYLSIRISLSLWILSPSRWYIHLLCMVPMLRICVQDETVVSLSGAVRLRAPSTRALHDGFIAKYFFELGLRIFGLLWDQWGCFHNEVFLKKNSSCFLRSWIICK